jgi:hypothetical protein
VQSENASGAPVMEPRLGRLSSMYLHRVAFVREEQRNSCARPPDAIVRQSIVDLTQGLT